jgi:hypothetical protein
VGVSAGGRGVGEEISFVRSDRDAQLERNIERIKI